MASIEYFNKYACDILLENAPIVKIKIHLNKIYFNFDYPSSKSTDAYPSKIIINIIEYGKNPDDTINMNDIKGNVFVEFPSYAGANNPIEEDIPQHQAYYNIENTFYLIEISYAYIQSNESTIDYSYSKKKSVLVDNNIPTIFEGFIAPLMIGELAQDILKTKEFTLWFDTLNIDAHTGDILGYKSGYNFQKINEVDENDSSIFNIELIDQSHLNFILKMITTQEFLNTIHSYYNGIFPEEGEILFTFKYNQREYKFYLKGNINTFMIKYRQKEE